MRALIMVLVRLVQSPTCVLSDIFPFHACAESGRAIRAALPNRNNGASLWAELRSEVGNGAGKPESGLGWCAPPLSGRSGPESCRAFNDLGRRASCAYVQGGSSELEPTSDVASGYSRREWTPRHVDTEIAEIASSVRMLILWLVVVCYTAAAAVVTSSRWLMNRSETM